MSSAARRSSVLALLAAVLVSLGARPAAEAHAQSAGTPIHAIQGAGAASSRVGQTLTVEGIVTGIDDEAGANFERVFPSDRGLFVQAAPGDADDRAQTSEGIFVGGVNRPTAFPPGTRVRVSGIVRESFGETRLVLGEDAAPTRLGTAAVPAPVRLDAARAAAQDAERRPYFESLEGMNVSLAVGTATAGGRTKFGETFLQPGVRRGAGDRLLRGEAAPDLLAADSDAGAGDPENPLLGAASRTELDADLFDVVRGLEGPFAFAFDQYRIVNQLPPRPQPRVEEGPIDYPYDALSRRGPDEVRLASFNVENLFPVGGQVDRRTVTRTEYETKRDRLADAIGDLLERPDVIALQEVVDLATARDLAARLGGYRAFLVEGRDSRGIDVAFLVRSTLRAGTARQLGRDAREREAADCSDDAGRLFDRPPLALEVRRGELRFTVVANHFASKAAPDACRIAQAAFVRGQVARYEAAGREVAVAGDLNAFEDERPLAVLEDERTSLENLWDRAPAQERYSFQFGGRLQTLDHVLVTDGLAGRVTDVRYVHLDTDYYDRRRRGDGHRASDHDPVVVTLRARGR